MYDEKTNDYYQVSDKIPFDSSKWLVIKENELKELLDLKKRNNFDIDDEEDIKTFLKLQEFRLWIIIFMDLLLR